MALWLGLVAAAYLLGSVPFSYLLVRALRGVDVRRVGSGNAGATNVARTAGKAAGLAALILDAGKGAVAVLAAQALGAPPAAVGAAAVAVVVGHCFPLFLGFRGGKGVATGAGVHAVLAPLATAVAAAGFVAVLALSGFVALGSVSAAALLPAVIYLAGRIGWTAPAPAWLLLTSAAIAALVVASHYENLRRLWAGTEERYLGDDEGGPEGTQRSGA